MPVIPTPVEPFRRLVVLLLVFAATVWSASATLQRDVWVGFEGRELTILDRLGFVLDGPQRLSVREPLQLNAAAAEVPYVGHCSSGSWIHLTSAQTGETGFPVLGEGSVDLLMQVQQPIWWPISVSPVGWDLDSAVVDVHLGPGWSLLAITGGDRAEGAWCDRWSWWTILSLVAASVVVGWAISWRTGFCALVSGVAIGPLVLGAFFGFCILLVTISVASVRWFPWRDRKLFSRGSVAVLCLCGMWLMAHSVREVAEAVEPRSVVEWIESPRGVREFQVYRPRFALDEESCEGETRKLGIQSSMGDSPWLNEVQTPFQVEPAWMHNRDSLDFRTASTGPEPPHWGYKMGHVEWLAATKEAGHPRVSAGDSMRIVALPPVWSAIARILGLVALWILWVRFVAGNRSMRQELASLGRFAPKLSVVLLLALASAPRAEIAVPMKGEILRTFTFDGSWTVKTTIVQAYGPCGTLVVPVMEGETPLVRMDVRDGQVVLKRGRAKFPLRAKDHRGLLDGGFGDTEDLDPNEQNMLEIILAGEIPRPKPPGDSAVSNPTSREEKPDSAQRDAYLSGDWREPAPPTGVGVSWEGQMASGPDLVAYHARPSGWVEHWVVRCTPRYLPTFQGLALGKGPDSRSAFVFHPKPGDSLRVRTRSLPSVAHSAMQIVHASLTWDDARFSSGRLWMRLRVSASDTLQIRLPSGARDEIVLVDGQSESSRKDLQGIWKVPVSAKNGWAIVAVGWSQSAQEGWLRRAGEVSVSATGANAFVNVPADETGWIVAMDGRGYGPRAIWWLVPFLAAGLVVWLRRRRALRGGALVWVVALGAWPCLWELLGMNQAHFGLQSPDRMWYLDRFDGTLMRPWMIVVPKYVCYVACLPWLWAIRRILLASANRERVS